MKKNIVTSVLFLFSFLFTYGYVKAQSSDLYMPLNIKKVYDSGVRSYDGNPGKKYWENHADYNLQAEIIPDSLMLKGNGSLVYYNESPDTLKNLTIRLYQDIYKKGNLRDFPINEEDLTNGVNLKEIKLNGKEIDINDKKSKVFRFGTNLVFGKLPEPIPPGGTFNIDVKWDFHIPDKSTIRMGAYRPTDIYMAYWYPQIAVYDDIDGWDQINYRGLVEFYNDFNNYDIKLTTPKGYVVWATGILQNPEEVLRSDIYKKFMDAKSSDDVVNIITQEDYNSGVVTTDNNKNTWHFKAENVPDVSFGISNNYNWDASSVVVDQKTGRRTFVSAAYKDSAKFFDQVGEIAAEAMKYLSTESPGYPYPYPAHTTYNGNLSGGGGMETPMMAVNGVYKDLSGTAGVTCHEMSHNYMPFFMGINERKYSWMDEGWARFFPFDFIPRYEENKDNPPEVETPGNYQAIAGMEKQSAEMTPSYMIGDYNSYREHAYSQPATAYYFLKDMLGHDLFYKALHEYMDRWNGKHPIPYDFFFTFNDVTGKNLDWYWNAWFFDKGYPDLGIKDVKTEIGKINVTIDKLGSVPVPVNITVKFKDGSEKTVYKTAEVWKDGNSETVINVDADGGVLRVELGKNTIPDVNPDNNVYEKM